MGVTITAGNDGGAPLVEVGQMAEEISWYVRLGLPAAKAIESATINTAKRAIELRDECGSLSEYFWRWEPEPASRPRRITRETLMGMATTPESVALSKDLRRRGWTFVGPTTIYAFMQAMGLVNDHVEDCDFSGRRAGSTASPG